MLKWNKLLILGLVCLQVSQIVSQDLVPPDGFCVGNVDGHHAFPGDCNAFIYCRTEEAIFGRCIDNLHFRPDAPGEGVCTYPDLAGCDPNAGGPGQECNDGDFWEERVPLTCNQYIRCVNGVTTPRQCAGNLHWDTVSQQCTTPALSDCPYPICSENPTPGEVEHLPHPTDCNLFYICMAGEPVEQSCAPGQHWDRHNNWCTTPDDAECILTGSPPPDPEEPGVTEEPPEVTEEPNPEPEFSP